MDVTFNLRNEISLSLTAIYHALKNIIESRRSYRLLGAFRMTESASNVKNDSKNYVPTINFYIK